MPEPSRRLCDNCRSMEATHHELIIEHGVELPRHLCDRCFRRSAQAVEKEIVASLKAEQCEYCAARATTGGIDSIRAALGIPSRKYMCSSCSQEYCRFTTTILQRLPASFSREEELAAISKLSDETDWHMRQWLADRQPKQSSEPETED